MPIFTLSKSLYLRTLFCDLISLRASCPFDISHDSSRLFQVENLLPDVRVLGATYLLNQRLSQSPFPVVGAHAVDLWQVWLNPYPIWEEGPSVTLFWTNLIFAWVPRKKLCGFLSVYAHPEIVHSRPRLFKRCIAPCIHQINHLPANKYLGKQSHYPLEIYPPDSAINLLNNWGRPGLLTWEFCWTWLT